MSWVKGQSSLDVKQRGLGVAYLDYLQKLVTELRPLHRKLLFWGDIAMGSPELIRGLPEAFKRETIAVAWVYDAIPEDYQRFIKPFSDAGMECWVAPGVNNWSRVYPNFGVALNNIQTLTAEGQEDGCTGQLNTVWNDDGETLFNANWYGVLFGAATAWEQGKASIPAFNNAYGRVFHGDASGKSVEAQKELIAAHALLQDKFKRSDASDSLFWVDPWSLDGQRIAPLIRPCLSGLRLHAERAIVLIREARNQSGVREVDALDAMELGARRMDLLAYKFQLSDEIAEYYASALAAQVNDTVAFRREAGLALDVLNSTNGKFQDMRDGYSETREMYEKAWLESNRRYWLRTNLARYDMAIELWLSRIDKMRGAQRQLLYDHTLPTAAEMGIPAPPSMSSHQQMKTTIAAKTLVTSAGLMEQPRITFEDGVILSVTSRDASAVSTTTIDLGESVITAGFLDIHMHGAAGHDVMEAQPQALHTVSSYLARSGVTEFLATTVTASLDTTFRALDGISNFMTRQPAPDAARIAGIHIEGPFVSHAKKGMHPAEFIVPPSVPLLDRLWEAARGQIRLMTIAPELPEALETIVRARDLGIRVSVGHSNATKAEALAGLHAGATTATHTFNAMRALNHREPGILGVVLDRDDIFADLICDGLHVSPEAVRLWFKAKGPRMGMLITDALEATGMPDGVYKLGQTTVHLRGRTCRTDEGVLAGSVIMLDQAVENFRMFTNSTLAVAVRMASANPARMLGLPDLLSPGAAANFNIFDGEGRRTGTILRGELLNQAMLQRS